MRTLKPDVERIGEHRAGLGESVVWSPRDNAVLWTDITGRRVLRSDFGTDKTDSWNFPEETGFVQPASDGDWLVGQENSIVKLNSASGRVAHFVEIEAADPTTRTNDAGCDRQGRLFVGTMRKSGFDPDPVGSILRLEASGALSTVAHGLYIPNGIAFSPDGATAYYADTYKSRRQVWRSAYDIRSGKLTHKEPFLCLTGAPGRPDGAAVDADGCYWLAAVRGWRLLRYTPEGRLDLIVELPVERPSKLAFGGGELKTVFISTIRDGLSGTALEQQPLAGHLLAIDIGIAGLPSTEFVL